MQHLPQSEKLPARDLAPRAVVIHSTGRGLARYADARSATGDESAYDAVALDWYETSGFPYYGHILVGQSGVAHALAPESVVCWHTATLSRRYGATDWRKFAHPLGGKLGRHGRQPHIVYDWWDERHGTDASPLDLLGGERKVNQLTFGIDLLPDLAGEYSASQMATAAGEIRRLCETHGIPFDRSHVLGHEDLDPWRRGTIRRRGKVIGVPWDPGTRFNWLDLYLDLEEPK